MKNQPLFLRALWSALGVTAYIAIVATIFNNGNRLFGRVEGAFANVAFLLLFIFSALVTGTIVLLPPIRLYLDGQKKEGVQLLLFTAVWLGIITLLAMIILAIS